MYFSPKFALISLLVNMIGPCEGLEVGDQCGKGVTGDCPDMAKCYEPVGCEGKGVCQCLDRFTVVDGQCQQMTNLEGTCSSDAMCGIGGECKNNKCSCKEGFVSADGYHCRPDPMACPKSYKPKETACVHDPLSLLEGEDCWKRSERKICEENLECTDGKCTCPQDYPKGVTAFKEAVQYSLCIQEGAQVDLSAGEPCADTDSSGAGLYSSEARFCQKDLFCYLCPAPGDQTHYCRELDAMDLLTKMSAIEPPQAGSTEAPKTGASESPQAGSTEAPKTGASEPPQAGSTEAPKTGASEPPQAGSTEAPKTGASEPPQAGSTEALKTGASEPPQAGSTEAPKPAVAGKGSLVSGNTSMFLLTTITAYLIVKI